MHLLINGKRQKEVVTVRESITGIRFSPIFISSELADEWIRQNRSSIIPLQELTYYIDTKFIREN